MKDEHDSETMEIDFVNSSKGRPGRRIDQENFAPIFKQVEKFIHGKSSYKVSIDLTDQFDNFFIQHESKTNADLKLKTQHHHLMSIHALQCRIEELEPHLKNGPDPFFEEMKDEYESRISEYRVELDNSLEPTFKEFEALIALIDEKSWKSILSAIRQARRRRTNKKVGIELSAGVFQKLRDNKPRNESWDHFLLRLLRNQNNGI